MRLESGKDGEKERSQLTITTPSNRTERRIPQKRRNAVRDIHDLRLRNTTQVEYCGPSLLTYGYHGISPSHGRAYQRTRNPGVVEFLRMVNVNEVMNRDYRWY
jgi:hypothetical protein